MNREQLSELLTRHARELGEHFDAVQILASTATADGTNILRLGVGNWFTRQGMAHDFINMAVATDNAICIEQALNAGAQRAFDAREVEDLDDDDDDFIVSEAE